MNHQVTPIKRFAVGDKVRVIGYEQYGIRQIEELYNQASIPGGVRLNEPVDLFRSWNEDELVSADIWEGQIIL